MGITIQIQCVLFSIPMTLHLFCIYILYVGRNSHLKDNQRYFFMNLSFSEFLICFVGIVKRICKIYGWKDEGTYVRFIQAGIATFIYYFIMIVLTLDRFWEIFLSLRYPVYFSPKKTKIAIATIWGLSICFTLLLCILNTVNPKVPNDILTYFYFIFGMVCIVVSTFTYAYIARKIYDNKINEDKQISAVTSIDGAISNAKKRKILLQSLYLPILLLVTFLLFVIIPEILYFYYDLNDMQMSDQLYTFLTTSYFVAYTSDVFIYVLGSKYIRRTILRRIGIRSSKVGVTSTSHSTGTY